MLRQALRATLSRLGIRHHQCPAPGAHAALYQPRYSPWLDPDGFGRTFERIREHTLVDSRRCWILYSLARQAVSLGGEIWECGVYRGGTALLLAGVAADRGRRLRLFDTFAGMPLPDPRRDWHRAGDFSDTSLSSVRRLVDYAGAVFHPGTIPTTFHGLQGQEIALAHIDVDLHQSVIDCCSFIYPRLKGGGVMVFDDYGWPTCPGARQAVDEFFDGRPEVPLVLSTGQAIVFRLPLTDHGG